MKKLILGSVMAAALFAAVPASATVWVSVGPPPVRYEVVPAPRVGWVWAPGYWGWRHGHHVWVRGHWVRERVGYVYAGPHWVAVGPRWVFVPGRWHHHRPGW